MKWLAALLVLFVPSVAGAQAPCASGATCVPSEDLKAFVELLKAEKCRAETPPKVTFDPITIVVDRSGRLYYSGSEPLPYKLHLDWCNYQLDALGGVNVQVAEHIDRGYGFRFRPKATLGLLAVELFKSSQFSDAVDGGILLEPAYFHWVNLNGYVGFRSVGVGLGFDITKNFGAYLGYSTTWGTWRSNPMASLYFSFW